MNLSAVVMLLAAIVLGVAAVQNRDPRDIVRQALNKPAVHGPISTPGSQMTPMEPMQPSANTGTVWTSV